MKNKTHLLLLLFSLFFSQVAKSEPKATFRSHHNRYVVAELGGGSDLNANRIAAGPWEQFDIIDLNGGMLSSGDEIALRTIRGFYVVAELGGGSTMNANRTGIGPWETFKIIKVDGTGRIRSGDQVAIQSHHGQYVVAELGGNYNVNANRRGVGPWETFTIELTNDFAPRRGLVRQCGRATCDDDGAFNALGATMMWGAWAYKNDRAKLEKNLAFLQENGFDYIRVLGVVGRLPWWEGRVVDWRWPDYDQVIAGLTDLAYDQYGIRIEWTLIGDGDQMIPFEVDRFRLVDRFVNMSRGREHKIMHFEIANEAWQNGFDVGRGYEQLSALTRYMNQKTDIIVAASAPSGGEFDGDYCREARAFNGYADLWTFHYDRSARQVDGFWRHVRQPWESCGAFASNNEPMGPGSSVEKTTNPYLLVAAAINSYVSNVAMYVWHTESGVWGGTHTDFEGKSDLYENPSGTQFRAMKELLPADLANWQRQNTYNNSRHPFIIYAGGVPDRVWTEGFGDGVVRAYGTVKENEFVVLPIGIRNFVKMAARRTMTFKVYDIVTGQVLMERTLQEGEAFTLNEDGKGTYLIMGRYL